MRIKTLRIALVGLFCLVLLSPAFAGEPRHYPSGGSGYKTTVMTRLHLGLMTPEGDSNFWSDNQETFTGVPGDLEELNWTLDLEWSIGPRTSVVFSTGIFDGSMRSSYLDFLDDFGGEIEHTSTLRISPLTLGMTFYPGGRDRKINPYLGAGGGFYMWSYREAGDFIFFDEFDPEFDYIDFDVFEADGAALGVYALVGLDLRVTPGVSVFAEGRWTQVDDEMNGQFDGFGEIDLSGKEVSLGVAWRF